MEIEYIYNTETMSLHPKEKESPAWKITAFVLMGFILFICIHGILTYKPKVQNKIEIANSIKN